MTEKQTVDTNDKKKKNSRKMMAETPDTNTKNQ